MNSSGGLAFDLSDLLRVIEFALPETSWKIKNLDCVGEARPQLHAACDEGRIVSGQEIFHLSNKIFQVIDGDFYGYKEKDPTVPWITILAIDASWFEVDCGDVEILNLYRCEFEKVVETEGYNSSE